MDAVATEVEDHVLNAHTVIGLDTLVIDAISYMVDLPVLLIWFSLLILQRVRVLSQGAHPHLKGSFLLPTSMRSTFVSLKQPNLPPLLLLPRPVETCLSYSSTPWIVDTGASDHISGNKVIFSSHIFVSFTHYYLS